jgi:hypothetical protein
VERSFASRGHSERERATGSPSVILREGGDVGRSERYEGKGNRAQIYARFGGGGARNEEPWFILCRRRTARANRGGTELRVARA